MEAWQQMITTIICAILASSGLWAIVMKKIERKDIEKELLLGLAHDRILYLGMSYINRDPPYITEDEYDNLYNYLFVPYEKMGGNGSAKRVMTEIEKLPIKPNSYKEVRKR